MKNEMRHHYLMTMTWTSLILTLLAMTIFAAIAYHKLPRAARPSGSFLALFVACAAVVAAVLFEVA